MSTFRDLIEGPRWAGISGFIKDTAFLFGLKLNIDVDKGWLRETVRFEVEGGENAVAKFKTTLYDAMADYQKRVASK